MVWLKTSDGSVRDDGFRWGCEDHLKDKEFAIEHRRVRGKGARRSECRNMLLALRTLMLFVFRDLPPSFRGVPKRTTSPLAATTVLMV